MGAQDTKTLRADTLLVGVVVALLASLLLVLNTEPASAAKDQGRLTPIVVAPVPQKKIVPVRGSDGRWHVMYELQLTNTLAGPATLRSADVVNADNGSPLEEITADPASNRAHSVTSCAMTASCSGVGGQGIRCAPQLPRACHLRLLRASGDQRRETAPHRRRFDQRIRSRQTDHRGVGRTASRPRVSVRGEP
jgi:hypothetical protein